MKDGHITSVCVERKQNIRHYLNIRTDKEACYKFSRRLINDKVWCKDVFLTPF